MGKRQFKAETKQLLDLMINSIYTHREIFLRELISNASDALDKLKFRALTEPDLMGTDTDLGIRITLDKEARTITLSDNGIGMTQDEVVENIGTIAKSGTKEFFEKMGQEKSGENALALIGQFGVGFYSAFMVAKKVTLITRAAKSEKGVRWESAGDGSYTVEETDKESRGTAITLHLRDDIADRMDNDLLDPLEIETLVKRYSDFIRYPIKMEMPKGDDGKETELKTLNSMVPLWQRAKQEVTDEQYRDFYHAEFHAWDDPIDTIHTRGEGTVEYTALLFIPSKVPYEFWSPHFERGLKLYSRQVFIMEKCKELLPEYLGFVKGLVDSPDFSLNLSREVLQHDRQLKTIAKNVEKKVLDALKYMVENKRDDYEKFWEEFGRALKGGVYAGFGREADKLKDLLLFPSSHGDKPTTLKEYVGRMKEGQSDIYYAAGRDRAAVEHLPQMEALREKGYEVLYFIDKIDEFMTVGLHEYEGKKLRSIAAADLALDKEAAEEQKKKEETHKGLIETVKKHLDGKVAEVRLSPLLKSSPACIVSGDGGLSLTMEQTLNETMRGEMAAPKAKRVLELNPDHAIFATLTRLHAENPDAPKLRDYAALLYDQSLLTAGLPVDDPAAFAARLTTLMVDAGDKRIIIP
ncbi:MAG TPA: molecular chaperone HtpG [bacterium]|nr:molecular chaperone HtpG [bacterium]